MKPAPFEFTAATSLAEALEVLHQSEGDGKVISGGQSLMPVLAMRLSRPSLLVDINRVPGLDYFNCEDGILHIGGLVRHCELVEQQKVPLLAEAAKWIGHAAIRSRGTFGGSIAHADSSAELPVVATALEATLVIAGPGGEREVPAAEFFVGALDTCLEADEILIGARMPVPGNWGFAELSRRHGDFGMVSVVVAEVQGQWRIAVGGVSGTAHRPQEAEAVLNGGELSAARLDEASRAVTAGLEFSTDIHASAEYRSAMTQEFTRRALAIASKPSLIGAIS
ncbi:xanthine dehydrogenase family protein subunit M [Paeniglutamicibacter sp. ZC-3]|uniref:FAD binding domain-containing protein n=1 Tax=Paeniglutamicibacter sp. ZC-3 TaxID=2986919 RepID=UPI0021F715CB|nr:xanthine dehydrogenase family protein subunit M [Paeniglutamicibacter sp. ZC-3]MCV9994299.1 xanthine dehydrogenase family protein subunit M [Paeniglutamicibacter sp. ZC-3]